MRFPSDRVSQQDLVQQFTGEQQEHEPAVDVLDAPKKKELSVEQWIAEMISIPAPPAAENELIVEAIQCQTFSLGPRFGTIFVNLSDEAATTSVVFTKQRQGLRAERYLFRTNDGENLIERGEVAVDKQGHVLLNLELPSRKVVLMELVPVDD
ncbi:MAG: hypothetical protein R3C03_02090 [Pirellulaceae bacterium]